MSERTVDLDSGAAAPEKASSVARRGGYRLRGGAEVYAEVGGLRLPVDGLDPEGVEVAVPDGETISDDGIHQVRLLAGEATVGPLAAEVRARRRAPDGGARVDLRFTDAGPYVGRVLLGVIHALAGRGLVEGTRDDSMPAEIIVDPARISRLVQGFVASLTGAQLRRPGERPRVEAWLVGLSPDPALPLRWVVDGAPPETPFEVRVAGYNSAFVFRVEEARRVGAYLETEVPARVLRLRTRRHRRAPAPLGGWVSFTHPIWPGERVRRPLHDVSYAGLGFITQPFRDLVYPGLPLTDVEISWPGGQSLRVDARVRHVSPGEAGEPEICGLELVGDLARWHRTVERTLYPNTRIASDETLWDLFVESGYFNLSGKEEADFAALRRAFLVANRALIEAPAVGCQTVWPSPRGAEAGVTMIKLYRGAWMAYQIARRQGEIPIPVSAKQILREVLLHAFEFSQRDPGLRWFVTWVQHSGKFSRYLLHDLAKRWLHEPELAAIVPFRALEWETERVVPGADAGPDIGSPSPSERGVLLTHLATVRPKPYLAAHDFTAENLDLRVVRGAWSAAGLHRHRRIRVARQGGRPVAFAVSEAADDGLHLFGLFDTLRLFAVAEGGDATWPALLEDARTWYRELGKARFVLFLEDPWPAVESLGFRDLGAADTIIISADLLPDQLEHAWEITAPRAAPRPLNPPTQDGDR